MIDEHERTLWDAVLLVIKEANGRYGLKLYGHLIQESGGFTLSWLALDSEPYQFEMTVSYRACIANSPPGLISFISAQAAGYIREVVERRDKTNRALKELRSLRSL